MAQNVVNPKRDLCNLFKKMSDHFGSFSDFFFVFLMVMMMMMMMMMMMVVVVVLFEISV